MPYLNLDLDYFTHPKTIRLVALCGEGSDIFPIRLWAYCAKYHALKGKLEGYSVEEIEHIIGWKGESGKLINALVKVNFLHKDANVNFYVHDWIEHEGHIITFKERSQKANKARWGGGKRRNATRNPSRNPKTDSKESPNHTIPYHTYLTSTTIKQLDFLSTIPNYPFNEKTDCEFLIEQEKQFPDIDINSLLQGWKAYLLDKPLTAKSKPRSQLHNQFELAIKWNRHKKQSQQEPSSPSVLDKIKKAQQEANGQY